jgi:hypothetical protein
VDSALVEVTVVGIVAALAGVLVGAGVSEYFAWKREVRADERQQAKDKRDRIRAGRLTAIDHTRRATSATLTRSLAVIAGDPNAHDIPVGDHVYPHVDFGLIDDADVVRMFVALSVELVQRPKGSRATAKDFDQVSLVQVAIRRRLDAQEERVLLDQEPHRLDLTKLGSDVSNAIANMARPTMAANSERARDQIQTDRGR